MNALAVSWFLARMKHGEENKPIRCGAVLGGSTRDLDYTKGRHGTEREKKHREIGRRERMGQQGSKKPKIARGAVRGHRVVTSRQQGSAVGGRNAVDKTTLDARNIVYPEYRSRSTLYVSETWQIGQSDLRFVHMFAAHLVRTRVTAGYKSAEDSADFKPTLCLFQEASTGAVIMIKGKRTCEWAHCTHSMPCAPLDQFMCHGHRGISRELTVL
jgi:hypothetical protein